MLMHARALQYNNMLSSCRVFIWMLQDASVKVIHNSPAHVVPDRQIGKGWCEDEGWRKYINQGAMESGVHRIFCRTLGDQAYWSHTRGVVSEGPSPRWAAVGMAPGRLGNSVWVKWEEPKADREAEREWWLDVCDGVTQRVG